MKITGKIIAFLILLILLIALPVSILAYDVGSVVFDQVLVKGVLTEIVTESDLISVALQWFSVRRAEQRYGAGEAIAWEDEPDILDLLSFVDVTEWSTIREQVLPNDILEEWTSIAVDGTYEWIDSEDRVPDISWNTKTFKERVHSEYGVNAIQVIYDAMSPCSEDEISDFKTRLAAAPPGTDVLYNLCQFLDAFGEDQKSDYHESLIQVVEEIPDTFALSEELARTQDTQGIGPEIIKAQLLMVRLLMRLAPLIPVVLLLLLLAFAVRSLAELGRWWGIPVMLGGALLLVLSLIYRATLIGVLTVGPLSEVPPLVREEAISALMILADEVFHPLMWQSIIVVVLGLILIVAGAVVRPKPAAVAEAIS
ncbi:MAG: hypothetical protein ISS57_13905 [Anaerolineales bacterium]|nr:hypothetical protein [Anaerolineales bacterium]